LLFTIVYNRAWHLGARRLRRPALVLAIAAGVAAILGLAPSALVAASDLTSALLLGAAAAAMILGHYYLVVLDLPIAALKRLTVLLVVALGLRLAVVGLVFVGPVHAGLEEARLVAGGLWSADGVFVWMRLLFGLAGPLSLIWLVWKTVEIRSTQSATGILYVQLFLVLAGELPAKDLRVAAGMPACGGGRPRSPLPVPVAARRPARAWTATERAGPAAWRRTWRSRARCATSASSTAARPAVATGSTCSGTSTRRSASASSCSAR